MSDEIQVATPEATEIPSGAPAEVPVVAEQEPPSGETPDTDEGHEPAKPERTEAEKKAYALERRVSRLVRERAQLAAELEQARRVTPADPTGDPELLPPDEIDRRATEKARQIADMQRVADRCNEVAKLGAKEFKGEFDQVIKDVHEIVPLFDRAGAPQPFMQAILETDEPHKVLHYLGKNPEVAEELADMSPLRAARRLGQIERDLAAKPEPKPSSAPRPIQPVKSGAASGAPDAAKDPEAWVAWRNAQLRTR